MQKKCQNTIHLRADIFRLMPNRCLPNRNIINITVQDDIFSTNLSYSIQYKDYSMSTYSQEQCKPFLIKADYLPPFKKTSTKNGFVRINSYEELVERGKENKHIQWLLDWTTLTPTMFEVVQGCPGLLLYFSLDVDKYVAHLREQGCNEPIGEMLIVPDAPIFIKEEQTNQIRLYEEERLERDRIRKQAERDRIKRGEK